MRLKFLDRFFSQKTKTKLMRLEEIFDGLLAGHATSCHDMETYLRCGSGKVWATFKSLSTITKVMADTPFDVYKKGSADPLQGPDRDAIVNLLARPNPFDSWFEFLMIWVFHIHLTGKAFWVLDRKNLRGRPTELYALNPRHVRFAKNQSGILIGYIYVVNGTEVTFGLDEVIYFRRPHPDKPWEGIGDIEAGQDLFQSHINRNGWEQKFWTNGASPSGLLICEDQVVDEQEWEAAKRKFEAEYSGVSNSGKTAWLTGKWKYQQLGLTAQEMQNIESTKMNADNIFQMHGVPLSVAGMESAANYATAQTDDQHFRKFTICPNFTIMLGHLNVKLVPLFGDSIELRFNVSGLTNLEDVIAQWTPLFDRAAMTINELRGKAGLKPLPGSIFDQCFINSTLIPVEMAGVTAIDTPTQARAIAEMAASHAKAS